VDEAVERVKREYQERADAEAAVHDGLLAQNSRRNIDELLLPVGPATASLLATLIRESGARAILEIGTSFGYSTLWLAEAARATGGLVTTLELHENKVEYARTQIAKAGLAEFVDFRIGDALSTLERLDGPFELVLLDLWKDLYVPAIDLVYPKLARGALVVADNMTYPERARPDANRYRAHIRAKKDITSVLLDVGSGLELSRFR
jgi:predicted O-methyltransferase YrrM